jgi:hypothetical protein
MKKFEDEIMRMIFCIMLLTFAGSCLAQDDDIPTYHNKWESFSKMREQDIRSDLATFTLGGLDESMGKQQLAYIPVSAYENNYVEFNQDDIHVKITSGKFDQSTHKLQYYDQYVVRIDNKPFYGMDGQMPKKTIQSIAVTVGKDSVQIPSTAFADLYEPRFCAPDASSGKISCSTRLYISGDKRKIYIYMLNSSGKGGYEVTWVIEDKKYLRRVIDYDF